MVRNISYLTGPPLHPLRRALEGKFYEGVGRESMSAELLPSVASRPLCRKGVRSVLVG